MCYKNLLAKQVSSHPFEDVLYSNGLSFFFSRENPAIMHRDAGRQLFSSQGLRVSWEKHLRTSTLQQTKVAFERLNPIPQQRPLAAQESFHFFSVLQGLPIADSKQVSLCLLVEHGIENFLHGFSFEADVSCDIPCTIR